MSSISIDLSGKIDKQREQVFRDVISIAATLGIPVFVVGACARDLFLDLHYGLPVARATMDIDFGVRVKTWGEFSQIVEALAATGRYSPDAGQQHRLRSIDGQLIDIVPFGGVENAATRKIDWPPGGIVFMNALGFEEAYRCAVTIRLAPGLEVPVSSLAGLALMKLIAWKDRHQVKDAKDLKMVMSTYLQAGNRQRLESGEAADLLDDEHFESVELTGARLLGRDIGLLLTPPDRDVVIGLLHDVDRLALEMTDRVIEVDEAFESARQMLAMLEQGILDTSKQA